MEAALLRIHVQDSALALGQVRPVVQDLLPRKRRGDDSRHVECLFRLRLAGRSAEIAECRDGRVVYPDDLRRRLVGVRRPDLRGGEDVRQAVFVRGGRLAVVKPSFVFHNAFA